MLLRLTPGPAEALFGITAAPMASVTDGYGRVIVPNLNLRGSIEGACDRLRIARRRFDPRKAARKPFEPPEWAAPLVEEDAAEAMTALLDRIHPRDQGEQDPDRFEKLAEIYRKLDRDALLIRFCEAYYAALEARAPDYGQDYAGRAAEQALLEEMTYARNDSLTFKAITCFGRFARLGDGAFLIRRAETREKGCLNPNIILCRSMEALGLLAERFPGATDRASLQDRRALLDYLPALSDVLRTEGRNNGACRLAAGSIRKILHATGAPEALEAYIDDLEAPKCESQWMIDYTKRYHERSVAWLKVCTGQDLGIDVRAWKKWYAKNAGALVYLPEEKRVVIDAKRAKAFRDTLKKTAAVR